MGMLEIPFLMLQEMTLELPALLAAASSNEEAG